MLASNLFIKCIWMLIMLNCAVSSPIPLSDEEYIIDSRLNNYRKRFTILTDSIDNKFSADLQALIEQFNSALNSKDLKRKQFLLENYEADLNAEFAAYLQYQLDTQHLNQDINMEKWFLEQLLQKIDNSDLAADIKTMLPLYEKAKQAKKIEEKYEYFADVDNEIPKRLMNYFEADPAPISMVNVQLQYFHEFLLYMIQEGMVGIFENDIQSLLNDVDKALSGNTTYEDKIRIIDVFDRVETNFERFLNAKAHQFELYKFGLQ